MKLGSDHSSRPSRPPRRTSYLALVAVLALALAISGLLATGGGTPTATADPGGSDAADETLTQRSGDRVTVDPAALRAAQVGDTITLDLPSGPRTATVTFRDDQSGFSGWSGTVGNGWFDAVLGADGTVRINVDLPGASYAVEPGSAGTYRMVDRTDRTPPPAVDDGVIPPRQAPEEVGVVGRDGTAATTPRKRRKPRARILIVYSPEAARATGGRKAMRALAQSVVHQSNAAFGNSKVRGKLVLAGVRKTSHEAKRNLYYNLKSLWKRNGKFDRVPRLRKRKRADLVHLIVRTPDDSGACGLGYIRPRKRYAYSTSTVYCARNFRSATHEIGHNLGGDHDAGAAAKPLAKLPARGLVNLDKTWITIMAYWTQCDAHNVYCNQIPYFSNPYVKTPAGVRTGKKGKANNAGVLRKRIRAVARFYR